jgi:tetratricopeptide (TPR) repeat protein/transcriptional regulator with XRE-family HTH domain
VSTASEPPSGDAGAFGDLLRCAREAAGLSQEALAERAGLSPRGLLYLERGRHRPHPATLRRLADALALTVPEREAWSRVARSRSSAPPASESLPPPPPRPARAMEAAERVPADVMVPFVGRTRELALLERHLAGPPTGGGAPVLLLAGEPGIGKTRLLQEIAQQAGARGMTVLTGSCRRRGSPEPYAPLLEALEQFLHAQPPRQLRADLQGCAWLVRLLPELAEGPIPPLPPVLLPVEQERRLMFGAVGRLLANLEGPRGTLLLLDDLQWAGTDALELVATLAHAVTAGLRVIGAYRDNEVGPAHPLQVQLADLAHRGLAVYHPLGPLRPEEAAHLLDEFLRDEAMERGVRERVLQRAGGLPFFLVSYAQSMHLGAVAAESLPWDIGQSLRQRVAALPADAREVLSVGAVVGQTIPPWLVMAAAELSEPETLAALDAARGARLLEEVGENYCFAHEVIRETVEADLGPARRIVLHRRIAEALEGHGDEAAAGMLAYHYARSGLHAKAVLYLEQAGDRAVQMYANEGALAHYTEAREHLRRAGADPAALARLDEKRGSALHTLARHDEALEALEAAARWQRAAGDLEREGLVTARIAAVHFYRGTAAEGQARVLPVLERLEEKGPSRALAALYAAALRLFFLSADPSLPIIERAGGVARTLGDDALLASTEVGRGLLLLLRGHLEEARSTLEAIIPLAEVVSDYATTNLAMDVLAEVLKMMGEFEACRTYRQRVFQRAEQVGDPVQVHLITAHLGEAFFLVGDWKQARAYLERGLEPNSPHDLSASHTLLCLGELNLAEGNVDEASRYLEVCLVNAQRAGHDLTVRNAQRLLARRDLLAGHPDEALRRLEAGGRQAETRADMLLLQAWALLESGHAARADDAAKKAIALARGQTDRLNLCEALLVQGTVHTCQGRWREASASFAEARSLAAAMPNAYAEGRILFQMGSLQARQGELEQARTWLTEALAIFQRLGAMRDREGTEEALRRLW